MLILVLSLTTFFNLVILHIKFKHKRYNDMIIDSGIFVGLGAVSGGTLTGLAVATSVSFMVSLYLLLAIKQEGT